MVKITAVTEEAIILQEDPSGLRTAYVRWHTNCSACGDVTIIVPAHHWKSLRDILLLALDEYPELTGTGTTTSLPTKES